MMTRIKKDFFSLLTKGVWLIVLLAVPIGFVLSSMQEKKLVENYLNQHGLIEKGNGVFANDSSIFVLTKADGFGGAILCLTETSQSNIVKLHVISHAETPLYFEKCSGFIEDFSGMELSQTENYPDAVSGATLTSKAIQGLVGQAYHLLSGEEALPKSFPKPGKSTWGIALLITLSIASRFVKKAKALKMLNWLILSLSLLVVGFALNKPLTLAFLSRFIILYPSPIYSDLDSYLLLLYASFAIVFFGKNQYCKHICPFGAFQECCSLITKSSGKAKVNSSFAGIPLLLTGIVLIPVALFRSPGLGSYEIYSGVFDFQLSSFAYLLLLVVLVLMFFSKRPWCQHFCPTGVILSQFIKFRNFIWPKPIK